MTTLGRIGVGIGAFVFAAALAVGGLLFYYRPSVEYAYVDIRDMSEHPLSGWWVLGGAMTAVLVVAGTATWVIKRVRSGSAR